MRTIQSEAIGGTPTNQVFVLILADLSGFNWIVRMRAR
jgi:hypothetical protein